MFFFLHSGEYNLNEKYGSYITLSNVGYISTKYQLVGAC